MRPKANPNLLAMGVVAALIVGAILSACAPAATPAPALTTLPSEDTQPAQTTPQAATPAPTVAATSEPTSAGPTILRVATLGDIQGLDAAILSTPRENIAVRLLGGDGMTWGRTTDPGTGLQYATAEFRPGILESWERREEGGEVIYTMHIRKGCYFPSGRELTAKDYVYMHQRVAALNAWVATLGGDVKGDLDTIIDDYTIETRVPNPNFLTDRWMIRHWRADYDSVLVEEHATAEDPWAQEWVRLNGGGGVGPYTLDHITPGVEALFVRNEDYCAPDYMQGTYDQILLKIIPSAQQQALLLKAGEIDMAPELPVKEVLDLVGEPGIEVLSFKSQNGLYFGFDNTLEPFNNIKVRHALAYAINYDDIIDGVFLGHATPPGGLIPVGTNGSTSKYWVYEYDPEKARDLLAEAGYPDGFEMDLYFDMSRAHHEDTAVLVKAALEAVGVRVTLVQMDSAAFREKIWAKEFPALIEELLAHVNDTAYTMDLLFTSGEGHGLCNFWKLSNDEMNQIIFDSLQVVDPETRYPMYERAVEILDTELPAIMLVQPDYVVVMREGVEGFVKHYDEYPYYHLLYPAE